MLSYAPKLVAKSGNWSTLYSTRLGHICTVCNPSHDIVVKHHPDPGLLLFIIKYLVLMLCEGFDLLESDLYFENVISTTPNLHGWKLRPHFHLIICIICHNGSSFAYRWHISIWRDMPQSITKITCMSLLSWKESKGIGSLSPRVCFNPTWLRSNRQVVRQQQAKMLAVCQTRRRMHDSSSRG